MRLKEESKKLPYWAFAWREDSGRFFAFARDGKPEARPFADAITCLIGNKSGWTRETVAVFLPPGLDCTGFTSLENFEHVTREEALAITREEMALYEKGRAANYERQATKAAHFAAAYSVDATHTRVGEGAKAKMGLFKLISAGIFKPPKSHHMHSHATAIRDLARAIFLTDPRLVAKIAVVAETTEDYVRAAIRGSFINRAATEERIARCLDLAWGHDRYNDPTYLGVPRAPKEMLLRTEAEVRAALIAAVMAPK